VPDARKADVAQSLLNYITAAGYKATTGFIGNKYILPALLAANQTELLLTVALETSNPSLGYQVMPPPPPNCCWLPGDAER
jgi:hypothetical protein